MNPHEPTYFENIIYAFLLNAKISFSDFFCEVDNATITALSLKIFDFLDIAVGHCALITFLRDLFFPEKRWFKFLKKVSASSRIFSKLGLKGWVEKQQKIKEDFIKKSFVGVLTNASDESLRLLAKKMVVLKQKQLEVAFCNAEKFNQLDGKKCLLVSSIFVPTWQPTFYALKENGWVLGSVLWSDIGDDYPGYGGMPTKDLPIDQNYFSDPFGAMIFMATADNYPILLSGEAYYYANWDAQNAVVLYTVMGCIARAIRTCRKKENNNLFYFMYDGLKPVSKNASTIKDLLSITYQRYMCSVDRIIYNSNGESFGDFVENTYDVTTPRLHFPRYSFSMKSPMKRLGFGENGDEYHMVCITACLDENLDATRDNVPALIRVIVSQGIHFHYYNGDDQSLVHRFIASIPAAYRPFFHSHPVCRDQQVLLDELHQYHIGINPADYLVISKAICLLQDRKYQDGMQAYIRSTYPTSTQVYLAAGLSIITTLATDRLFKNDSIALLYSEFKNLKRYLNKIDLKARCVAADQLAVRQAGEVRTHIHQLIQFMERQKQSCSGVTSHAISS